MARRITFIGVVRFTDRVLVAGYSPSEADDALIVKEVITVKVHDDFVQYSSFLYGTSRQLDCIAFELFEQ